MNTPDTHDPADGPSCARCSALDTAENPLLTIGALALCRACDAEVRAVFATHLQPVADERRVGYDTIVSALALQRRDGRLVVHVHTFRPGLVIGKGGVSAKAVRDGLVACFGLDGLQLNIVEHSGRGCSQPTEPAPAQVRDSTQ